MKHTFSPLGPIEYQSNNIRQIDKW